MNTKEQWAVWDHLRHIRELTEGMDPDKDLGRCLKMHLGVIEENFNEVVIELDGLRRQVGS